MDNERNAVVGMDTTTTEYGDTTTSIRSLSLSPSSDNPDVRTLKARIQFFSRVNPPFASCRASDIGGTCNFLPDHEPHPPCCPRTSQS